MHPTRPAPVPDPNTETGSGSPPPRTEQPTEKGRRAGAGAGAGTETGTGTGTGTEPHLELLSQVRQQHGHVPHAHHVEPHVHQGGGAPVGHVVERQAQASHGQPKQAPQAPQAPQALQATTTPGRGKPAAKHVAVKQEQEQQHDFHEKQPEQQQEQQPEQVQPTQQQAAPPPIAVPVETEKQAQQAHAPTRKGSQQQHKTHEEQPQQPRADHVYGQTEQQQVEHKGQPQAQPQQQEQSQQAQQQQTPPLRQRVTQRGHALMEQARPYVACGRQMLSDVGQKAVHGMSIAKQKLATVRPANIRHMKHYQIGMFIFILWASYALLGRLLRGSGTESDKSSVSVIHVQRATHGMPPERHIPLLLSPIHIHPHISRQQSSTDMFAQRTGTGIGKEGTWDWFAHINEPVEMLIDNLQDRLDVTVKTPGMNKSDISIRLKDDVLVISGRHTKQQCTPANPPCSGSGSSSSSSSGPMSSSHLTDAARCTTMETQFWRSLHLPSNIAQDQIKADYDDKRGMVHVHMPKLPFDPHRPSQIQVQ